MEKGRVRIYTESRVSPFSVYDKVSFNQIQDIHGYRIKEDDYEWFKRKNVFDWVFYQTYESYRGRMDLVMNSALCWILALRHDADFEDYIPLHKLITINTNDKLSSDILPIQN